MAASAELFYHFPRCGTCDRARAYLAARGIPIEREVDAKAAPLGREASLDLARRSDRVVAIKGERVTELAMRGRPSDGQLLELLLGPQGTLRVPSLKIGKTLYVGFSEAALEKPAK